MIIKELIKEINQGKKIEKNLPQYLNEMMTLHNNAANYSLAFHYYTFVEMLAENDYSDIEEFGQACEVLNNCIKTAYSESALVEDLNESVKSLEILRNQVIKKMKVLTAYTDTFQIYEYIINRLEGKYNNDEYKYNDSELSSMLEQYIFNEKDAAVTNSKIQEVLGQLPVRITKSRFLELIKNSLNVYNTSDKSAVDTFIYMIKTGAMLDRPEGYNEYFKQLVEYKETLQKANFKELSIEEYADMRILLEKAVELIEHTAQAYYTMQEVINDIYIVLLTKPYANMPGTIEKYQSDMKVCAYVITKLEEMDVTAQKEVSPAITSEVNKLVGKQESLSELCVLADSAFYEATMNQESLINSMMLTANVKCLDYVLKLASNSIFVELSCEAITEPVDEVYMKRTETELIKEFDELLSSQSQIVCRAIMGNVLSKLPVFFNNKDEVMEYIGNSLRNCKDASEKNASAELLFEIMQ